MINLRRESNYARLNLALCYYRLNELPAAARILDETASEVEKVHDIFGLSACAAYRGLILAAGGDHLQAIAHFSQARDQFKTIGAFCFEQDTLASLARSCLALEKLDEARQYVEDLWAWLQQQGAAGLEFPIWAYETCAEVFAQLEQHPESHQAAQKGAKELIARSAHIIDPVWRTSFLSKVPEHSRIVQLWQKIASENNTPLTP